MKKLKIILNGIINENPTFVLLLGMCPVLITSSSMFAAFGMAICILFVLILSNVIISALKNVIPNEIRVPSYILVIATVVTLVDMLVHAYLPEIYNSIGSYISMIVVNCIILGRAESFASKNSVIDSLMDAIGISVGFFVAVFAVAFVRELLGTGCLDFSKIGGAVVRIIPDKYVIPFFTTQAGAFCSLGMAIAIINAFKNHNENVKKEKEKAAKLAATKASAEKAQAK